MQRVKNPVVISSLSLSLLALVISIFMVSAGLYGVNDQIVLNVNSQNLPVFGYASDVFSILAIFGAIIIINSILIFEIYNRRRFISYALSAGNIVISVVVLVAVYMIVSLN